MSLYFALLTVENNKNKKSVKFQGDILNDCDFMQIFVFTTNHHLKQAHFDNPLGACLIQVGLYIYFVLLLFPILSSLIPFIPLFHRGYLLF